MKILTIGIIALNVILSFYCFNNKKAFENLCFSPYAIAKDRSQWFRFISHGFIHADIGHLAFNMITLYFFGSNIEGNIMDGPEYLLFYLSAIVFATLPTYQKQKENPSYKAVGASGAVSSILFVLVLYAPWSKIYLHFFIPIYFVIFAVFYIIYSSYQSKKAKDNVAHDVHLWGALYGIAYMLILHPESFRIFLDGILDPPF